MKQNKKTKENTKYPATKSLVDEKGNPLMWEIKPLTTKEHDYIREESSTEVAINGKKGAFRPKVNTSKYIAKLICASVVYPNLNDKELQDSYNVMTPEDLIREMIDDPSEYNNFVAFIQEYNGFGTLEEKVEEAKN